MTNGAEDPGARVRTAVRAGALCVLWALTVAVPWEPVRAGKSERLALRYTTLDLPGPPSKIIPSDLDGDGLEDLIVVVGYTEIEEIGEDRIENMVQMTIVIPALFERREVLAYRATRDGDYEPVAQPLELSPAVLHMEAGPPGLAVIAMTDEGLSQVRLADDGDGRRLEIVPILRDRPILTNTGSFFAAIDIVHELDGDGISDVLFPSESGLTAYLGTGSGLDPKPASRVAPPGGSRRERPWWRWYPYPEVREVNGDGNPDLVFESGADDDDRPHVYLGKGGGRFGPLRDGTVDCHDSGTDVRYGGLEAEAYPWPDDLTALRDLDGDGRAEAVTVDEEDRGDGFRKEMKDAKRPRRHYRFHVLRDDLSIEKSSYFDMIAEGYTFEDAEMFSIEQFRDLDGDGREDLVTVTLKFSILQAVKILTTKRISIGLDFHVWNQRENGSFREVQGLDLSEKLKLNLNNLKIGRFAQFAGDFDGDGRQDFTHFGRGTTITIHRGQPGCRYPKKPDLTVELQSEPEGLDLITVEDMDGDGRSDIRIIRPMASTDPDVTAPVRLDLYLTGGVP